MADAGWVSLGVRGQELSLRAAGPPDGAYPGGAYPAVLQLDAGDLQLQRRCHVYALPGFCREVEALHRTLTGRASLATTDDLEVALEGDGTGHVSVLVEAGEVAATDYRLRAQFQVDQTFLLPFARGLKSAFPDVSQ